MKKIIIILFLFTIIFVLSDYKKNITIPESSIRFRVIANSNSKSDQEMKIKIKDDLEKELFKILINSKNIEDARNAINQNMNKVESIMNNYDVKYSINYGNNYFPKKEYKGIKYDEGIYESLVITIGEGLGKNWWCVLFPPLCLLDENENLDNYNYELYASKLINKFTSK